MQMIRIFFLGFLSSISSTVIDIRYPQFFHPSADHSAVEITEGKTAGSFIAFINLINSTNLHLNEWILNSSNADFQIQANALSYSLVTKQLLDRERQNFYNFTIDAEQLVSPFEKLSKEIHLRILDLNDCTPMFNQTVYQATLIPNQPTFTIQAVDCDEPNTDNSRISYSLSNYQDLFRINQTTGTIECLKTFQTDERFEVILVASDHGKPSLSSTVLVQIQVASSKSRQEKTSSWIFREQSPTNMLILAGILSTCFVLLTLLTCLICCLKYKIQQRRERTFKEKKYPSTSSIDSRHELPQTDIYDAVNIFPNTFYLPVQQQSDFADHSTLQIPPSISTSSSPISTTDLPIKVGSDDGCYCSSDMSSEQSNHILLLNPSSLNSSSKHVRFHPTNNRIDGVLQRFENLYGTQATTGEQCASYV